MAKPTEYPDWAGTLTTETKTVFGVQQELVNRTPVPASYSDKGVLAGSGLVRQYINQQFYLLGLWVRYVDTLYAVGHIHLDKVETDPVAIGTRFGGTWTARGTQAIGTITANVFERTS